MKSISALVAILVACCSCGSGGGGKTDTPQTDTPDAADSQDSGATPDDGSAADPGNTPDEGLAGDPGTGDTGTGDATPDTPPDPGPYGPAFAAAGSVQLSESAVQGGGTHGDAGALLFDAPVEADHSLLFQEGPCEYYVVKSPGNCTPACKPVEYCSHDSVCKPARKRVSAGVISISGTKTPIYLVPDDPAFYTPKGSPPDDLFGPGDPITVKAPGAEIPGFEAKVNGVAVIKDIVSATVEMIDGQPLDFKWKPAGDGSVVEISIQTGWHGAPSPAIIWCSADEAAGVIQVPKSMVEAYPPAGGMGLFPNVSWIRRVSRQVVDSKLGPIEVKASSMESFSISHNPW